MSISAQATELAGFVEAACTKLEVVYPAPPAHVEMYSAVVSPAPAWGSFEDAGFCDVDVSWEIILIAGTNDFLASMDWFFERVTELAASRDLGVETWSQPERIQTDASTQALAVRVQLTARTMDLEA